MNYGWKHVEPLFQKVDHTGYGDRECWDAWYEESWNHIGTSGLAEATVQIDCTVVKLRILSLCWLAHDFCFATFGDDTDLYWHDLGCSLKIDPLFALLTVSGFSVPGVFSVAELYTLDGFVDDSDLLEATPSEIGEDLAGRIVGYAAYYQRRSVVEALLKGYGSASGLFAGMYANCQDDYTIISEREEELSEIREVIVADIEKATSSEELVELQDQLRKNSQSLEKTVLVEYAKQEKRERALNERVHFCDDASDERMKGLQWCEDRCPLEIRGWPELTV